MLTHTNRHTTHVCMHVCKHTHTNTHNTHTHAHIRKRTHTHTHTFVHRMNAHINTICTHVQIYTYGFACACVHLYPQHADTRHTSSAALTNTPCSNQRVTSSALPSLAASRIACSSAVRGRRAAGGVSGGDGMASLLSSALAEAGCPSLRVCWM